MCGPGWGTLQSVGDRALAWALEEETQSLVHRGSEVIWNVERTSAQLPLLSLFFPLYWGRTTAHGLGDLLVYGVLKSNRGVSHLGHKVPSYTF